MIRAGPEIGRSTIINFYTIHTTLVPVLLISFMALHFWRVRKAGGVVLPDPPTNPEGQRQVAVAPALFAVVVIPLVVIAALVPLPYFRYRDRLDGKWFLSDLGRRTAVVALGAGDSEAEQALFVLLLIVFVVFTLTGVWFRGTGMALA